MKSPQNFCTPYIVWHGQTDWNTKRQVQGHTDILLNVAGEEQARLVANLLSDIHFNAIYSSDLVRAQRTAEIIVLGRELEVKTTELLREQYFGKFEGSLWAKTAQILMTDVSSLKMSYSITG